MMTVLKMWTKWWMIAVAGGPGSATEHGEAENEKKDNLSSATLLCWSVGGNKTNWRYNSLLLRPDDLFGSFKCGFLTGGTLTAAGGRFWNKQFSWDRCGVKTEGRLCRERLNKGLGDTFFFAPLLSAVPSSSHSWVQGKLRLCEDKKKKKKNAVWGTSPCWAHLSVHTLLLQLADGSLPVFKWHHQHQGRPFSSRQQDFVRAFGCLGPRRDVTWITRRAEEMKVHCCDFQGETFRLKKKKSLCKKANTLATIIVVGASLKWTKAVKTTLYMVINAYCIQGLI